MIKFFRKIRQKILSENKFSKYLIYAIGEIILVVIGILIALQINNLNQKSQEKEQLKASLELMQLNLNEDIRKLDEQIAYNKSIQEDIDNFFKIVSNPEGTKNIPLNDIGNIALEKSFYPVSTALKSMESGGHFKWINDKALKESIYIYYAETERFSRLVEAHNHFAREYVEGFVYKNWDLADYVSGINPYLETRAPRINNRQVVIENVEFESIVVGRKLKTNAEIGWAKDLKETAQSLYDTIENYLTEINK
ncbi:hypothetical protein [Psychroserpens algicola]|uniref:hypothetical protein n=1 Tax=Psychroserpens algicola TaxID=1719034 RepID=UPI0019537DA2|nr:hypothetical protein [Psychroserpens algicola]